MVLPLIALVDGGMLYGGISGFGHFIVIVGTEGEDIIYHDPEIGPNCRTRIADLLDAWCQFESLGVKIWRSEKK